MKNVFTRFFITFMFVMGSVTGVYAQAKTVSPKTYWDSLKMNRSLKAIKGRLVRNPQTGKSLRIQMSDIRKALEKAGTKERVTIELRLSPPARPSRPSTPGSGRTFVWNKSGPLKLGSYSPYIGRNGSISFNSIRRIEVVRVAWDRSDGDEFKPIYGRLIFKDARGVVRAVVDTKVTVSWDPTTI